MRSSRVSWTGIGPKIVKLGETWVFSRARLSSIGLDGAPDLFAEFEVRDGVPECVAIRWESKPDGRGIRTSDLHVIKVDGLVINAFLQHAKVDPQSKVARDSERDHWAAVGDLDRAIAGRSKGPHPGELQQVAEIYRAHVGGHPTAAVESLLGMSRRTAARRVQQARAAGLLPATTPGRKEA